MKPTNATTGSRVFLLCTAWLLLGSPAGLQGQAPDLTAGTTRFAVYTDSQYWDGTEGNSVFYTQNLGPTGLRGWVYMGGSLFWDSLRSAGAPWQILVTSVGTNTPAVGILQTNDVILGAAAGVPPVSLFTNDSRVALGNAITAAEAGNGKLSFLVNRYGIGTNLNLTIQLAISNTAYSATAPYNCPKSALLLSNALNVLNNKAVSRSVALALLASGNTNYLSKVQTYARSIAPSNLVLAWPNYWGAGGGPDCWSMGYNGMFLAEYYMATHDSQVTNGLTQYIVMAAKSDTMYGCYNHSGAVVLPYHTAAGVHGFGAGYGPVNACGLLCNLSVVLGQKTGIPGIVNNAEVQPAINRATGFFSYYVNKGTINYGEMSPAQYHGSIGKNSQAALFFGVQGNQVAQSQYFEAMALGDYQGREWGHNGSGWCYCWGPLGVNLGGTNAAAAYAANTRWQQELFRRCDGSFAYDCPGDTPCTTSDYWGYEDYQGYLDPTAWNALALSVPRKALYITGKNVNPTNYITAAAVSNAVYAGQYTVSVSGYGTNQLLGDLSNTDPVVRHLAAQQLGAICVTNASISNALTGPLIAMTTNASAFVREAACDALGAMVNTSALNALAAAMYDTDVWVRYKANQALDNLGTAALPQLTNILTAFITNAIPDPLVSINWNDPCGWGNGVLADLLFNKLGGSTINQSTNLLYPAVRAGLRQSDRPSQANLNSFLVNQLSWTNVQALAPDLIAAATQPAQADEMWDGAEGAVLACLAKYGVDDGLAALSVLTDTEETYGQDLSLAYQTYGTAAAQLLPLLSRMQAVDSGMYSNTMAGYVAAVQANNPPPLHYFKQFTSAAATPSTISLAVVSNVVLSVASAPPLDGGVLRYTWSVAQGPGPVSFSTNGTPGSSNCTASFSVPGAYVLQAAAVNTSIMNSNLFWDPSLPGGAYCMGYYWPTWNLGTWTNNYGAIYTNLAVNVWPAQGSLTNTAATSLTAASATLHATLNGVRSNTYVVWAYWGTTSGGTNAAAWSNSGYVGSLTNLNVIATNLSLGISGLSANTAYYFSFRATNAVETVWAANVLSFATQPVGWMPTLTWDANGSSSGPSDGGGAWINASNTWWWPDGPAAVNWADNDNAVIGSGGAGGTITLGTVAARQVTFTNFSGTYTLTGGSLMVQSNLTVSSSAANVTVGSVIGGAGGVIQSGNGTLTLSGANTYSGPSTLSSGTLQFNSAGSIGGSGRSVTASAGATVAAGYAIDNGFLNRVLQTNNAFAVALGAASGNALDFNTSAGANLPNASLGAVGPYTYSGTLTPNGTTYRLGGGGGTLTFSPNLTGSGSSLVVSGPGTVLLNGTANTFTGNVTINSGTLQVNSAGAFNNVARAVYVESGGQLAAFDLPNAFAGSTIYLEGGTSRFGRDTADNPCVAGGNFVVRANSQLDSYNASPGIPNLANVYGSLDFAAADPGRYPNGYVLTLTDNGVSYNWAPSGVRSRFTGSIVSHSGAIYFYVYAWDTADTGGVPTLEFTNTWVRAGMQVTIMANSSNDHGATTANGSLLGSLGVAALGGAELLTNNTFTMFTFPTSAFTLTNSATPDTTGGMWSQAGTTTLTATLTPGGSRGSIGSGQTASFASTNAGYVSLTGLTTGNTYPLTLTLANPTNQATVLAQLAKNPAFTNVTASGTSQVALKFTAPAATTYLVWDNVHSSSTNWYLGGNLTAVSVGPILTASAALTNFVTTAGAASPAQSFPVSGVNLTANITNTAPSGFEVSTNGLTYAGAVYFPQSGGSAGGTLYARLAAATAPGSYGGNIALTSAGAAPLSIAAAGTVTAPGGLTLSNTPATAITSSAAALNATLTCAGTNAVVYAYWNTVNGGTSPALWTNSAAVGTWTNLNATNLSYTATGLAPNTTYYFTLRGTNAGSSVWATNVLSFTTLPAGVPSGLTWDANGTGTGVADGDGAWINTSSTWWNGTANVNWTDNNNAWIGSGGTGGTITLGTATAGQVTFTNFNGTYTLAGGNLTVNSNLTVASGNVTISTSVGGPGGITQSGAGTVVLNGAANTFTGNVTINSGTLQVNSAGAFNNVARAVYVETGGQLTAFDVPSALAGSTIYLEGGTNRFGRDTATDPCVAGGNFVVRSNSRFDSYNSSTGTPNLANQYGSLDFAAADPGSYPSGYLLTLTDNGVSYNFGPRGVRSRFTGSIISQNGAIYFYVYAWDTADAGGVPTLEFTNTWVRAGKQVTVTSNSSNDHGAATANGSLIGSLGVATLGGAELLTNNTFTMFTFPASSFTLTNSSTPDTTGGLWSQAGTTTLTATLAPGSSRGSIGSGQTASFTSTNAGYVSLTGLTVGTAYPLTLTLANAGNQAAVLTQLAKNPAFTNVTAYGASQVTMQFTAPAATTYFVWDNVHSSLANWYLGGDLTGVALLTGPSITASASLTNFVTTAGTASPAQSFPVTGVNLTGNITNTAPTGFEVSTNGSTYAGAVYFPQSGGSAGGTLYVRLAAATAPGSYGGNVVLTSAGAPPVSIAATGTVSVLVAITLSNTPATAITSSAAALNATLGCVGVNAGVLAYWNTVNGGTNAALWTNSAYVGSWTNVASTNISYSAAGLAPNRMYYFTFRGTNAAGSVWATNVLSFTTLAAPPAVALTSPTNNAVYTLPATITLTAAVTTNGNTVNKVQFYQNATNLLAETTVAPFTYAWTNATRGTNVLTARLVYNGSSTVDSAGVSVTVLGLPSPWLTADIGSGIAAGSASESNGVYTVKGAGNISAKADNFRFVYQTLSGDGEIRARIPSFQNTGTSARIGVMMRETLTSGSRVAFMGVDGSGNYYSLRRTTTSGTISSTSSGSGTAPNVWVRLVRTGNSVVAYKSSDGSSWTTVNTSTVTMATTCYFGLAVASGTTTTLNTSTFDTLTVVP